MQMVLNDPVVHTLYKELSACRAMGILRRMAGHIAQIDILQSGFEADVPCLFQEGNWSWSKVAQTEVGYKPGHVPG